jgi:tRNA U34 5-carboxymethylaminomethyl modifying GTPase MnmE/TrmE
MPMIYPISPIGVVLLGKTGTGKTSLINAFCAAQGSKKRGIVGHGAPTTTDFQRFDLKTLVVWDSAGLELGKSEPCKIMWFIRNRLVAPLARQEAGTPLPALLLYCVSIPEGRWTHFDTDMISRLQMKGFLCKVVLTKQDIGKAVQIRELRSTIHKSGIDRKDVHCCSADTGEGIMTLIGSIEGVSSELLYMAEGSLDRWAKQSESSAD